MDKRYIIDASPCSLWLKLRQGCLTEQERQRGTGEVPRRRATPRTPSPETSSNNQVQGRRAQGPKGAERGVRGSRCGPSHQPAEGTTKTLWGMGGRGKTKERRCIAAACCHARGVRVLLGSCEPRRAARGGVARATARRPDQRVTPKRWCGTFRRNIPQRVATLRDEQMKTAMHVSFTLPLCVVGIIKIVPLFCCTNQAPCGAV